MTLAMDPTWRRVLTYSFWATTVLTYGTFFYMMANRPQFVIDKTYGFFNFAIGVFLIIVVAKLLFGTFHLLDDLVHLVRWTISKITEKPTSEPHEKMTRVQFFNQMGLAVTSLYVGSMLYGVTKGKFSYRVLEEKLNFPDLPSSFDGLRIVQISDMHLGSFNENFEAVQEGFDMINALEPDYIFFTGDLVNNFAEEAEPWIERIAGLKAKYGKFSILGNHDYGDYALAEYPDLKVAHFEKLIGIHEKMGFRLLRNESVRLERNGESIVLMGTENWGIGFHQYGDMQKTMQGVNEGDFKIMLSHDPTFWEEFVMNKTDIKLTMSGHTHGAQFGVELPSIGIKFSPVSLRYKRWGGLYTENNQHLYINRGFGFLAFPGRVGMPPEITLIEFRKS